ncbi:MAG: flippase-like domain-containing protein [Opitutae bacterium]|nr:flippase-like domain-containing protein [Opitutae bacterium]
MRFLSLLSTPAGTFLRYVFSLAGLGWLALRVDWVRFGGLRGVDLTLALAAALLAGLAYPLQAWRWQLLLRAQGLILPAGWVHRVFWIGQFCNSFLPGGVAGDAVRFGYLWREHPDRKAAAAASLLADRLLGLGALFALATLALGLHLIMAGSGAELRALLTASTVAFGLLLAAGWSATRTRWWERLAARWLGPERAAALHDAAAALGRQHTTLALAALLSVAVWLADFVSLWLLARSVGLEAGLLGMTVAAAAAYVAASLPVSIGGHGVREGALVAVMALLGLGTGNSEHVALLAVAFWAVSVGWSLFGGAVWLFSLLTGRPGSTTSKAVS